MNFALSGNSHGPCNSQIMDLLWFFELIKAITFHQSYVFAKIHICEMQEINDCENIPDYNIGTSAFVM